LLLPVIRPRRGEEYAERLAVNLKRTCMRPIALWGPPGAGKSTIAAKCAKQLGWRFIDLDQEIERQTSNTIASLFANGEEAFRAKEREVALSLLAQADCVIALGGGTLLNPETRGRFLQESEVFRVEAPHEVLVRRISAQKGQRPLLADGPLSETLAALLEKRQTAYQSIPRAVDTATHSVSQACDLILQQSFSSKELTSTLGAKQHIYQIGPGLLQSLGAELVKLGARGRVFIINDRRAASHHGARLRTSLTAAGLSWCWISVPAGELQKSSNILWRVLRKLATEGADKGSFIVALGGGATCDLAALTASLYMRGLPLVLAPTTTLSMIDAAIGGKAAINEWSVKNLIGSFYVPRQVIADTTTLSTLSPRERRAALSEAIKIALVSDETLLQYMEEHAERLIGEPADLLCWQPLIEQAAQLKLNIVAADFEEKSLRRHLNLGHTIGHALEANCRDLLHGEAVSLGLCAALFLSLKRGLCEVSLLERVTKLLSRLHLPTKAPRFHQGAFFSSLSLDKKTQNKTLSFLLLEGIGTIKTVTDISQTELEAALVFVTSRPIMSTTPSSPSRGSR
jgi:shikimate kinase / 3-dehydroquinate synthase